MLSSDVITLGSYVSRDKNSNYSIFLFIFNKLVTNNVKLTLCQNYRGLIATEANPPTAKLIMTQSVKV